MIQTPTDAPTGHYWTIQIADVFTTVVHQLGSASATPGGKFLLVGPDWKGQKPDGFIDILRMPTNIAGVFPRSFTARTPEAKAKAVAVLNQIGMYPLSKNQPGQLTKDCQAFARNAVYPPGVTPQMIAADPDASRPQWVNPKTFWDDLEKMLAANPTVGPADAAMADQARTLIALRKSNTNYKVLLDRAALAADAALHASSNYVQVGVDAGNGWQKQEDAGLWGTDWLHDDVSQRCTASNGSDAWRILVADDVRQGLFHAAELAQRADQHRHGQPRRQRIEIRDGRVAHHHDIAPAVRRRGGARELATSSRRAVRAHRAGVCADETGP